jgi:branched-chain amino acid transport system permease protein
MSIEPVSSFGLHWTITMIIIAVTGGLATTAGPVIGAAVVFAIQQLFQNYDTWSTLLTGVTLMLIVLVVPAGLWGAIRSGIQRLKQRAPFRQ